MKFGCMISYSIVIELLDPFRQKSRRTDFLYGLIVAEMEPSFKWLCSHWWNETAIFIWLCRSKPKFQPRSSPETTFLVTPIRSGLINTLSLLTNLSTVHLIF